MSVAQPPLSSLVPPRTQPSFPSRECLGLEHTAGPEPRGGL